jgi:hypothetical protein
VLRCGLHCPGVPFSSNAGSSHAGEHFDPESNTLQILRLKIDRSEKQGIAALHFVKIKTFSKKCTRCEIYLEFAGL